MGKWKGKRESSSSSSSSSSSKCFWERGKRRRSSAVLPTAGRAELPLGRGVRGRRTRTRRRTIWTATAKRSGDGAFARTETALRESNHGPHQKRCRRFACAARHSALARRRLPPHSKKASALNLPISRAHRFCTVRKSPARWRADSAAHKSPAPRCPSILHNPKLPARLARRFCGIRKSPSRWRVDFAAYKTPQPPCSSITCDPKDLSHLAHRFCVIQKS